MSTIELRTVPKLVQQQRLILTQELQLFLKLIQMNSLELKDYLEEQLIDNPALEEDNEKPNEDSSDEDFDFSKLKDDKVINYDNGDYPHSKQYFDSEEDEFSWENNTSSNESLLDHLNWQVNVSDLTREESEIASMIVGNINEDGYLDCSIVDLSVLYLFSKEHKNGSFPTLDSTPDDKYTYYKNLIDSCPNLTEAVENVLKKIQVMFDPPGACSRNLKECLRNQAYQLGYIDSDLIIKIINDHLEDLSKNDYANISDCLDTSLDEIKSAEQVVQSLEPKPGRPFFLKDSEKYIVPDYYVYKVGNEFQIQLNKDLPRIRISAYCRKLIKSSNNLNKDTKIYLKEKIEAAQRIMRCLEERDEAIRKVLRKIVDIQKDFFEHGTDYIKPLRLKDVAESVGVHESTVSRITSRRYIYTPQGISELKSLFSRKIETSHGKEISFEKVKSLIKVIVKDEPPKTPYSDEDISKILERRSIKVARRTVAKYRKILGIQSSSKRHNSE